MTQTAGTGTIDELRAAFKGEVFGPGDPGYDDARRVWNAVYDRRPAVVARCESTEDVQTAIGFATEHGLEIAVRGGAHSVAGDSALGGGMGWLTRLHGLSIDNLVSAQLVTADGRVLRAAEDENPDLFWAIRGGGGNFGVVTEFEFRLHEVGPIVHHGMLFWDQAQGPEVFKLAREQHAELMERLRTALPPLFEFATPMPYTAVQQLIDEANGWGKYNYEKGAGWTTPTPRSPTTPPRSVVDGRRAIRPSSSASARYRSCCPSNGSGPGRSGAPSSRTRSGSAAT